MTDKQIQQRRRRIWQTMELYLDDIERLLTAGPQDTLYDVVVLKLVLATVAGELSYRIHRR